MSFVFAFLVGGIICMISQILMEYLKFTPAIVTSLFVILGGVLEVFGLYEKLVKFGSAGALAPITNFGSLVVNASYKGILKDGLIGAFTNVFSTTGGGISVTIIGSLIIALIFNPKE